jgi:hypothetical protein
VTKTAILEFIVILLKKTRILAKNVIKQLHIPGVLGAEPLGEGVAEATACRGCSEGDASPTK